MNHQNIKNYITFFSFKNFGISQLVHVIEVF
jgi:hypothetical protein